MAFAKYRNISVFPKVYCSSSGDYFFRISFDVYMRKGNTFLYRSGMDFHWGSSDQEDLPRMPRYLEIAIYAAIHELLCSDRVKFYEYDQNKIRRYDNLRYHRPEDLAWLRKRTEAILNRWQRGEAW